MAAHYLRLRAAAQVAGLEPRTLRYYADKGLVPTYQRDAKGWRYFRRSDMQALRQRIEGGFRVIHDGSEVAA